MLSISDANRFVDEPISIRRFKPWWDILIDYCLISILLMTILAWTRVVSLEASGLICVLLYNSTTSMSFADGRYVNSRCGQESFARFFIHYPYVLFLEWVVMFACQKMWLKLPSVISKLDAFHDIFTDMGNLSPHFVLDARNQHMLPQLGFDDRNKQQVQLLHDKVMFLLNSRSFLAKIYLAKVNALLVVCMLSLGALIAWMALMTVPLSDFTCVLSGSTDTTQSYNWLVCNFAPSSMLYGTLLFNVLALLVISCFCIGTNYWYYHSTQFMERNDVFGGCKDVFKGLPGCADLQFCLALLKNNLRDGNLLFEITRNCISGLDVRAAAAVAATKEPAQPEKSTCTFLDETDMVAYITEELGLKEMPNSQTAGHLLDCLQYIRQRVLPLDLNIVDDIRQLARADIENNPQYFRPILESDSQTNGYTKYLEHILDSHYHGDFYTIMSAANFLCVRIVVISCELDKLHRVVYEPYSTGIARDTFYITFVRPHFFHVAQPISFYDGSESRRSSFVNDSSYRNKLLTEAARCIVILNDDAVEGSLTVRSGRTTNSWTCHDQLSVTNGIRSRMSTMYRPYHHSRSLHRGDTNDSGVMAFGEVLPLLPRRKSSD